MKTTTNNLVTMLFSWETQSKNVLTGIASGHAFIIGILILQNMRYHLHDLDAMVHIFSVFFLCIGSFAFFIYCKPILTRANMNLYIATWNEIAQKKSLERRDAAMRLRNMDTDTMRQCFERQIKEDREFIDNYDNSKHAEELLLFKSIMKDKNFFGRLCVMIRSYSYWAARAVSINS